MKATLSNYHQSPRKVGLVAGAVRGKSVAQARQILAFFPQKSSPAILKLLNSAVSNAVNAGASESDLFIKTIGVDKAAVLRRFKPMARGRAAPFRRTMSHVSLVLGATVSKAAKPARAKKAATKKTAKASK